MHRAQWDVGGWPQLVQRAELERELCVVPDREVAVVAVLNDPGRQADVN